MQSYCNCPCPCHCYCGYNFRAFVLYAMCLILFFVIDSFRWIGWIKVVNYLSDVMRKAEFQIDKQIIVYVEKNGVRPKWWHTTQILN